jgi:xanthine dehydrogenase accessory factor
LVIAARALDILRASLAWLEAGIDVTLVTLVHVEGNSSRAPGAQMAVAGDGQFIGSFSGGCIESAVVHEALEVLAANVGRTVRIGVGSPYIDLRLPCGGGIDLVFTPRPDRMALAEAVQRLEQRMPVAIQIDEGAVSLNNAAARGQFHLALVPPLRVIAFGQGEDLAAFAKLASEYGALVECVTPDLDLVNAFASTTIKTRHVYSRERIPTLSSDAWTAMVFLFHDQDWEESLLPATLALPAFYIGAIGSAQKHKMRLIELEQRGVARNAIKRIHGSIGLIPSTRDPSLLALSVLAEIAAQYRDFVSPVRQARDDKKPRDV